MISMDSWHSYPSVYAMGHRAVRDILSGPVTVQEKIDGSQFSFGFFPGGDAEPLRARSKGAQLNVLAPEKMFARAVEVIRALPLHEGWTYRGEYLAKPKHNALAYDRVPAGHIILFDINVGHEDYLPYDAVREEAERLGLEAVPRLHEGVHLGQAQLAAVLSHDPPIDAQGHGEQAVIRCHGHRLHFPVCNPL